MLSSPNHCSYLASLKHWVIVDARKCCLCGLILLCLISFNSSNSLKASKLPLFSGIFIFFLLSCLFGMWELHNLILEGGSICLSSYDMSYTGEVSVDSVWMRVSELLSYL